MFISYSLPLFCEMEQEASQPPSPSLSSSFSSPSPTFGVLILFLLFFPLFTTLYHRVFEHSHASHPCRRSLGWMLLWSFTSSCSRTWRCSSTGTSARGFRKGLMDSPGRIPGVFSLFDNFPVNSHKTEQTRILKLFR